MDKLKCTYVIRAQAEEYNIKESTFYAAMGMWALRAELLPYNSVAGKYVDSRAHSNLSFHGILRDYPSLFAALSASNISLFSISSSTLISSTFSVLPVSILSNFAMSVAGILDNI